MKQSSDVRNKTNRRCLGGVMLATVLWQSSEAHVLVDNRPMALVTMNFPNGMFLTLKFHHFNERFLEFLQNSFTKFNNCENSL